jgi:glycosyltransferase involved in cell wall biosynthesis
MPEVLGDAGVYFDPENPNDIARALRELIESPALRTKLAQASFERAQRYSWRRCAHETLSFLAEVARSHPIGGRT